MGRLFGTQYRTPLQSRKWTGWRTHLAPMLSRLLYYFESLLKTPLPAPRPVAGFLFSLFKKPLSHYHAVICGMVLSSAKTITRASGRSPPRRKPMTHQAAPVPGHQVFRSSAPGGPLWG